MIAVQARLDAARDKLDVGLDREVPRDTMVAAFQEQINDLRDELKKYSTSGYSGHCLRSQSFHLGRISY